MDYGQTMHSWMICEDTYASKSTFLSRTGLILLQLAAEKSRGRTVRMFLLAFQPVMHVVFMQQLFLRGWVVGMLTWARFLRQFPALGASGHLFLQSWYGISTSLSK